MSDLKSTATPRFWDCLWHLPAEVQDQAFRQYALFAQNPLHPSLRFKQIDSMCSVRVSRGYRALAKRDGNHFTWFWIGPHGEYERILKG